MPIYKGSSQINVGATTHTHTLADITDAGSAAGSDTTDFAAASHTHTLSNITDAGTAAASDTGDFEPSGAVSSHSATTSGVHGISAYGATLVDDADAATARTTLGLGTAATSNTGDFAPTLHTHTLSQITDAGTAAASNTGDFEASGAVSTHAAVTSGVHGISAFGATLVDDADASAARTTLGLGTAATSNTGDFAAASHTHALGDLSDVDTGGATTGQVLEFDGAEWVPATPSAGAAALDDLTDVSTAGATTGDVIVYNGSTWAPAAQSGGGEIVSDAEGGYGENSVTNIIAITQAQYDALTPQADTFYIITDATSNFEPTITTPADGHLLTYDSGTSSWVNESPSSISLSEFNNDLPAVSDSYAMVVETPSDKAYTVDPYAPAARTVTRLTAKTSAGTCNVLLANGGLSQAVLAVSSTQATTTSIANASVTAGDRLTITVSSTSNAEDLEIAVEYTQ